MLKIKEHLEVYHISPNFTQTQDKKPPIRDLYVKKVRLYSNLLKKGPFSVGFLEKLKKVIKEQL